MLVIMSLLVGVNGRLVNGLRHIEPLRWHRDVVANQTTEHLGVAKKNGHHSNQLYPIYVQCGRLDGTEGWDLLDWQKQMLTHKLSWLPNGTQTWDKIIWYIFVFYVDKHIFYICFFWAVFDHRLYALFLTIPEEGYSCLLS